MKKKNKKLYLLYIIFGILVLGGLYFGVFYGIPYITNKDVMGRYELVESNSVHEKDFVLNLTTWEEGKKENLKCSLWDCTGYHSGEYKIEGNKIRINYSASSSYCEYEIKKENNDTYLILKCGNDSITKYKKI